MNAVNILHAHLAAIREALTESGEISYVSTLETVHAKGLLLAAASEFEVRLSRAVKSYCESCLSSDSVIVNLVERKAIVRQYHTWFEWSGRNANTFFSMFGHEFKDWMAQKVADEPEFDEAIKAFLALGNDRNLLVHKDFASFTIELTAEEIFERYCLASKFVDVWPTLWSEFEKMRTEGKA